MLFNDSRKEYSLLIVTKPMAAKGLPIKGFYGSRESTLLLARSLVHSIVNSEWML